MATDTHQAALEASPISAQLKAGFPWLRFEPAIEIEYHREQYQRQRGQLRLNLGLAIAIIFSFTQLDRLILPVASESTMNIIRYAALLPALLVAFLATFLPGGRAYLWVIRVVTPTAMLAIAALVLTAWLFGDTRLFTALVLSSIFIYFLVGLPFYGAVTTNALVLVIYVLAGWQIGMPVADLAYNSVVLLLTNLIGAMITYNVEFTRRRSWLERQLLNEYARRDGLTGIYNRRRFDEHLANVWQQGIREQRPLTLMLADIDFFKAYNDRYGHQAGDEALKAVAAVLARSARRPLDLAARYGGEEFVVVLYDATREYAAELARHVMDGVRELRIPHAASAAGPVLTVSLGVAYVMPAVGRSPDGFVQLADQALYRAKDMGRNRVHVMEAEYAQLQTGSFRKDRNGREDAQ